MISETVSESTKKAGKLARRALFGMAVVLAGPLASGCGTAEGPGDDLATDDVEATSGALTRVGVEAVIDRPVIKLPPQQLVSDLKPDGVMRFYASDAATIAVQINVTNVGNMAAWAPAGSVLVAGFQVDAALYQYYGGTATMPNTVMPGQRGYLLVHLPSSVLQPCNQYPVLIDVGRNMQAGLPDPYANDQANVATQCLTWTSRINANNFSISGPPIEGSSISRIVSSIDIGRTDGLRCSQCHFENAPRTYRPPVAQGGSATISPTQVIGGLTWGQAGGWADRFTHQPTDTSLGSKPYFLKMLMQTWLDDGRKPGLSILSDVVLKDAVFTLAN